MDLARTDERRLARFEGRHEGQARCVENKQNKPYLRDPLLQLLSPASHATLQLLPELASVPAQLLWHRPRQHLVRVRWSSGGRGRLDGRRNHPVSGPFSSLSLSAGRLALLRRGRDRRRMRLFWWRRGWARLRCEGERGDVVLRVVVVRRGGGRRALGRGGTRWRGGSGRLLELWWWRGEWGERIVDLEGGLVGVGEGKGLLRAREGDGDSDGRRGKFGLDAREGGLRWTGYRRRRRTRLGPRQWLSRLSGSGGGLGFGVR